MTLQTPHHLTLRPSLCITALHPHLKKVLMGQVITRVQLKYQYVINPSLSPSVGVDAQKEEELDEQKSAPIDTHQRPHVPISC